MEIGPLHAASPQISPARKAAEELEVTFLSEMLKHAGLDAVGGEFGGGQGEAQFASFMREEQARHIVSAGGIGLADRIEAAMGAYKNDR